MRRLIREVRMVGRLSLLKNKKVVCIPCVAYDWFVQLLVVVPFLMSFMIGFITGRKKKK